MRLAAEAERFRVLCKVGFDGVCVVRNGRVLEANDSFAAMMGYSTGELEGMPVENLVPLDERANVLEHISSNDSSRYETCVLKKNGTSLAVEVCGAAISSGDRVAAIRDISTRREAYQALVASEDRFRDLVESSRELIGTHDLAGRILSANPAAGKALNTSSESLRGQKLEDHLVDGNVPTFVDYLDLLQREGSASGNIGVVRSDGSRRLWEYTNTLRTDGTSTPIVRVVARDVTEREESLAAIRHSEEHFRSMIENASDLITTIQPDGTISYQSPSVERVLGVTVDSVVGTAFINFVHPESRVKASEFLDTQRADPAANTMAEFRFRHHNASWRSFEVVARNLISDGAMAIVIVSRDVTERKLLQVQLAQANRLSSLGRLAATVAHEFNNVLMGIQPFAELMRRPNATPEMINRSAGHISNSIQRGKRIASEILRFTQPALPVTSIMDLGEWWAKFILEAEIMAGNVVRLVSKIPRGTCIVADRHQLSQVMTNLVTNARDSMPSGGTLTIEACEPSADSVFDFGVVAKPERFIQISVSDTGHGMSPEILEHVFEPLFTTKNSGGTGLGLAVAHQVLTQHGGCIFAESQVGRGTTFHLFFTKGVAPCDEKCEIPLQSPNLVGRTLLMIEDEPVIVEGISALLREEGMKVMAVGRGLEAAAAIERCHPDIVLLDFGLPDVDGSEVYKVIRQLDPSLPVIFATGHGDQRAQQEAMGDSRTRFLQKPFEMETLLEMIADLQATGSGP